MAALLYFDRQPGLQFMASFSIVWGAALLAFLVRWRQNHVARRWMRVEAQLESGTQTEVSARNRLHRVQATYSYSVQGGFYGGYFEATFGTEQEAAKLLEDLQRNRFWIRVNPANLDQSRLLLEER